ncbi:MAG: carboxypeptidase regulatory-like domain-containing protein [Deltaproteobacteria bacterium]|nr:carboxypeptidase regulatory-like domain-containing protein [Deltaproteobacteria bacterium]
MGTKGIRRACLQLAVVLAVAASAEAGEVRGKVTGTIEDGPAVVWIEGVSSSAVPKQDTVITHTAGGKFEPFLSVGFVGNSFVLRNDDGTMHNTHLYMRLAYQKEVSQRPLHYGATVYNVALPHSGVEVRKPIVPFHRYREETGFIEVVCNRHPDEHAFVLVFDHPYAAITKEDGSFTIPEVPPGEHQVRVWRAGSVTKGKVVNVKDSKPTEVVIEQG